MTVEDVTNFWSTQYTINPCPFCGAPGKIVRQSGGKYFIVCSNTKQCPAHVCRTKRLDNPVDVIMNWNSACIACRQACG